MRTLKKNGKSIHISDPDWISKSPYKTKKNSCVKIQVGEKTIYLASSTYRYGTRTASFYEAKKINPDGNINLMTIPHGSDDDTREKTLPIFLKAAKQAHEKLQANNTILVNCNHGRSRTGSVVALYLMLYENLSADDAIDVVTKALEARDYTGGIDIVGYHGQSYGQWLREYKPDSGLANVDENAPKNSPHKLLIPRSPHSTPSPPKRTASPSTSGAATVTRKRAMRLFATTGERPTFFTQPRPAPTGTLTEAESPFLPLLNLTDDLFFPETESGIAGSSCEY